MILASFRNIENWQTTNDYKDAFSVKGCTRLPQIGQRIKVTDHVDTEGDYPRRIIEVVKVEEEIYTYEHWRSPHEIVYVIYFKEVKENEETTVDMDELEGLVDSLFDLTSKALSKLNKTTQP